MNTCRLEMRTLIDSKCIFLDVYGTIVHEDDLVIAEICRALSESAGGTVSDRDIARRWWQEFVPLCSNANGTSFQTQRALARSSLQETIHFFGLDCGVEPFIEQQYDHWRQPPLFDDARRFLKALNEREIPVCLVSNIDNEELDAAISHHGLSFAHIVTSETARAYKPHPAIFEEALTHVSAKPHEVMHIGDSFANDVRGAAAVGISTIWLNRMNKPVPDARLQTDIVQTLDDVVSFFSTRP